MKKKYLSILLITVLYFSACKKDVLTPAPATLPASQTAAITSTTVTNQSSPATDSLKYIRLQLAKDSTNYDNILLEFKPTAQNKYLPSEDARKFIGYGIESLASFSSDRVPLAIDALPLPKESVSINLSVTATQNGLYKLNLLAIKAIPAIYEVWLKDNYKKDSLDFRHNPSYSFNLSLADTNSFGTHRFSLVIRENKALEVHLLDFTAVKTSQGTQLNWITENELNYTGFSIERSVNNGQSYKSLVNTNSSASSAYSYIDKSPAKGVDLYRLKITSLNGTVIYSQAIAINY